MNLKWRLGTFGLLVFWGVGILGVHPAWSQQDFPSRPIQIVALASPGGTADLHARALAPALEQTLKQPVPVLNKAGAGGALGCQFVAASKPDGYTLLLGLSSISWFPEVDLLFDRTPIYRREQFIPIALLSADPTILVVKSDSPWKTVADLVADAKSRPQEIRYSSAGFYSTLHLAMEMLSKAAGIKLRHIPNTGGGPAMVALLGGHVDVLAIPPSVASPQVKGGALRVLAGWGGKRIAVFPEVPTLKELGYDAEFYIWAGLFAPQATPPPVHKILTEATRKAMDTPGFQSAMEKMKTPIVYMAPDEFQKYWDKETQRLVAIVRHIGKVQ
jgi:tripartite-type tricarboxylate transporter receptor subunit TctC